MKEPSSISQFSTLPTFPEEHTRRKNASKPIIDYIKSIVLTSDEYITQWEEKALKKVEVNAA